MNTPGKLFYGAMLLALLPAMSACSPEGTAANTGMSQADGVPHFEVDATWQQQLPNEWLMGDVGGISVDSQGHVWVIQRPWTVTGRLLSGQRGEAMCCRAAPPVIEFDREGNVVQAWPDVHESEPGIWEAVPDPGGYGEWGRREHTVYIDPNDFVWVANDNDHVIYKMTRQGEHLLTIGEHGQTSGSNHTSHLGRPAGIAVDPETNEVIIADGYTNKRVIVFDGETGEYLRHWGAYGNVPEDVDSNTLERGAPEPQFRGPVHGIAISNDGHIYVADRTGNRIQEFTREGEFVQEGFVAPETEDAGVAYGVFVSHDPEQQWLYVNDGSNNKIWILRRDNMEVVGDFGWTGRLPGQFLSAHSMTVDHEGNIYVGETRGARIQKFTFTGVR